MSEDKDLEPVEQKEVSFYDDEITAIRAKNGRVYASLRHMCDALGIDSQAQARRIQRHSVLGAGFSWVAILATQGNVTQRRRAQVLRVDMVPLWLSGIRTSMVNEDIRPKLERFQQEAAAVLWEAFQEGRLTADPSFEELLQQDTDTVQAYQIATAVVKLARSQLLLEVRVNTRLEDHEERLETIEAALGDPGRHITPEQASQLSQAVKAIALVLTKRSGRNEFGSVYGELYRKFGITGYKLLPAKRFNEAMAWLTEWHQDLTGDSPF